MSTSQRNDCILFCLSGYSDGATVYELITKRKIGSFNEFEGLNKTSLQNTISRRLKQLVKEGLVYMEERGKKKIYHLTDRGYLRITESPLVINEIRLRIAGKLGIENDEIEEVQDGSLGTDVNMVWRGKNTCYGFRIINTFHPLREDVFDKYTELAGQESGYHPVLFINKVAESINMLFKLYHVSEWEKLAFIITGNYLKTRKQVNKLVELQMTHFALDAFTNLEKLFCRDENTEFWFLDNNLEKLDEYLEKIIDRGSN